MNLIIKYSAIKDVKKEDANPIKIWFGEAIKELFIPLVNSKIDDKNIAGRPRRKENLTESSFSQPNNKEIVIVIPERETPGKIAKAWPIPIKKELK